MKEKLIRIIKSETGCYLLFGVLTTVVSYVSFWLALQLLGYNRVLIVNTFSFICAAAFAYITNKLFVFKSKSWKWTTVRVEIVSFFSARIFSYFFEQLGLYLSTNVFGLEQYSLFSIDGILISKVVLSFAVVLINWAISKFFIFKKKG